MHVQAPKYGAFPAHQDERVGRTILERSAEGMQLVLSCLHLILESLPTDSPSYQSVMDEPGSVHLKPIATFLHARAHKDLAVGMQLQARDHLSRAHDLVHPHYHSAAGFFQLHFLIQQGLRRFYAALEEGYVIMEGNQCVV